MAKMFYTLEEAAAKLSVSEDEIREMAASGRIQEFRDRDKLMFKVDQIDLLSSDDADDQDVDPADMSSMIPLADSLAGDALDLADSIGSGDLNLDTGAPEAGLSSGSGPAISLGDSGVLGDSGGDLTGSGELGIEENPKQKTGVSIFDADDELDSADAGADTLVTDDGIGELTLESVGSGSGLLDLTRESDDTSLGAVEFLDDLYSDEESANSAAGASGLFEGEEEDMSSPAGMAPAMAGGGAMIAAEPYDGPGSGLVGGLSLAMLVALLVGMIAVIGGLMEIGDNTLSQLLSDQFMIIVAALGGLALVCAGIGFVLGKKS